MRIAYMALLALIVWFGLFLQFYISTEKYMADGRTFAGAIVQLLSYFTIQNNMLIAVTLTIILIRPTSSWGHFFSRINTLSAIGVYIVIVGLIYQLVLRKQHTPQGLFRLTDEIFHSISPLLFVVFWLVFVTKENIPWANVLKWLIYPLIYLFYILIRGAISGYYPYSFIDASHLGYQRVAINSVFILFAFMAVSACFISISRLLKKE